MITESQKAKWLEALRSDEFHQGNGFLKGEVTIYAQNDDGFCEPAVVQDHHFEHCCLGVLAETLDGGWEQNRFGGFFSKLGTVKARGAYLKKTILPLKLQKELATLNDDGLNFTDIAAVIEETVVAVPDAG